MKLDAKSTIETGKAILGIELGSTRIKAVLIDQENKPIAQGSHTWENQLVNGLWTYSIDAIWNGLQDCYQDMKKDVQEKYGVKVTNIPQRWSVAHLYQAILNGEEHVKDICFQTTLAGYIHWMLTGKKVLGVGDASGMFPIDIETGKYDAKMVSQFDEAIADKGFCCTAHRKCVCRYIGIFYGSS